MKKKYRLAFMVCALALAFVSCGGEKAKYVGTWVHNYDGKDGGRTYADGNKIAQNEFVLRKNGTFAITWVDKYKTKGIWLTNGDIAYPVTQWGGGEGKWKLDGATLVLDYEETTGSRNHEEAEVSLENDGKTLKVGNTIYHKK